MLVDPQSRSLFVHIQKTAGTSIAHCLKGQAGFTEFLRPHDPIRMIPAASEEWNYSKFAFVRNPFERMVSWHSSIVSSSKPLSEQQRLANPNHNRVRQYVVENSTNFSEFILHCSEAMDRSGWKPFLYNQIDYLTDAQGHIRVEHIGRYERLEEGFDMIAKRLRNDCLKLPHVNHSKHGHYRDYYCSTTRKIVTDRFARDLAMFNYAF